MLISIKQRRCYISKACKKRVRGVGYIYVIAVFVIIFLALIFKGSLDRKRLYVTYDMVDDSLVESLVSACVCNMVEYGLSGQSVIYRTVTPLRGPSIFEEEMEEAGTLDYEPLDDPEIFLPGTDAYLNGCYDKFLRNLKHNLKLTPEMEATISGVEGIVTISNFSVYNKYREFDDSGNETGYRIVSYTRQSNGMWTVMDYGKNTPVTVYNSFDKSNSSVTDTSVVASLTFDVKLSDYSSFWMEGMTPEDMKQTASYQRIVDITAN